MKIHLARLPALTAILLSLTSVIADTSSSGSSSSSVRDFKLEGDALLAKGEYLGASRAYSNAIGQSPPLVRSIRMFNGEITADA